MSKDVRRLFAAQKAAKANSPTSSGTGSPSLSTTSKRITHPLAKYDPKSFRLTCAICGSGVPIKSDSLWNAHLVSKAHQEAVAKLRAIKEQMQKREQAEAAERSKQQQQQQQQGIKRKVGGLVAYSDESDSESEDEGSSANGSQEKSQDSKRVKLEEKQGEEEPDEEDMMAGLPEGFFDTPGIAPEAVGESASGSSQLEEVQETEEPMEGVLPSGFFDDPEEDARIRAEVGGATADLQQRQIDAEFKALQADLARDLEIQEQKEKSAASGGTFASTAAPATAVVPSDQMAFEEKVEMEEQELEESIMARTEEEYMLLIEMQERLTAWREKKERLATARSAAGGGSAPSTTLTPSASAIPKPNPKSKPGKQKSILEVVREQERAKKEKERLAAEAFAKLNADEDDSRMASDDAESDESDEDIEAMMDWRARRV